MENDDIQINQWIIRINNDADESAVGPLLAHTSEVFIRHARRALHGRYAGLRQHEGPSDVRQEALLKILKSVEGWSKFWHSPSTVKNVQQYYTRVVLTVSTVIRDLLRKHKGRHYDRAQIPVANAHDHGTDTHNPEKIAVWGEFWQQVDKLDEKQRIVFHLFGCEGKSQKEVAEQLGIKVKTVEQRWRNARLTLMPILGDPFDWFFKNVE